MKSACAENHIDKQNTNLPKIYTCRKIYISNYDSDCIIICNPWQYLSERVVGATVDGEGEEESDEDVSEAGESPRSKKKTWKVLGTLVDKKLDIPNFLWAVMRLDDYEAYLKEIMKCGCIIYDVTHDQSPERFAEIRQVVDGM